MRVIAQLVLLMAAAISLSGCADLGYYLRSAAGQLQIMSAARPIEEWLGDVQAPTRLKERLRLSRQIRDYAASNLKLPDNLSYRRYADLHRSAVIWNVVAAAPYSITLHRWCFPITGCVSYRGYFEEALARAEAAKLAASGLESNVYPVPAYSTLGWLNWAGGDPLLNTFINYPEGELARLIFHELAHQVVYVKGDSTFNESFATAVERLGGALWLAAKATPAARAEYAAFDARRSQFRALALRTRRQLERIYAQTNGAERETMKQAALKDFRERYAQLRNSWGGEAARYRGYDHWVANANNASFGAQAVYDELVPGFEALFMQQGSNWQRFYDAVRQLAQLPRDQRLRLLKDLQLFKNLPQAELAQRR